ncbi:MAG: hypothetical protein NTV88_00405 [Candidatus Micrarchaeota archaeon]|nr:hypothetical protein [Candidatus Micrarchaeota archaeon]
MNVFLGKKEDIKSAANALKKLPKNKFGMTKYLRAVELLVGKDSKIAGKTNSCDKMVFQELLPIKKGLEIQFGAHAQDEAVLRLWNLVAEGKQGQITAWQAFSMLYDAPVQAQANSVMFSSFAKETKDKNEKKELSAIAKACIAHSRAMTKAGRLLLDKVADELIAYAETIVEKKK